MLTAVMHYYCICWLQLLSPHLSPPHLSSPRLSSVISSHLFSSLSLLSLLFSSPLSLVHTHTGQSPHHRIRSPHSRVLHFIRRRECLQHAHGGASGLHLAALQTVHRQGAEQRTYITAPSMCWWWEWFFFCLSSFLLNHLWWQLFYSYCQLWIILWLMICVVVLFILSKQFGTTIQQLLQLQHLYCVFITTIWLFFHSVLLKHSPWHTPSLLPSFLPITP